MARLYSTRQLLDPQLISMLNQQAANKMQFEAAQNRNTYDAIRKALSTAGSAGQNVYDQYKREKEVSDIQGITPEMMKDPVFRAAREEYIRTGSSGPMSNYIMQREAAKAREEEAKRRADQEMRDKAWHNAVRIAQARPEYGKVQKAMFDAADAGDFETAEILKKQLQAYETEFGPEAFGGSAEEALASRKKTAEAKAEKEATLVEDIAWQKEQEKKAADKSYEMRNYFMENFMPVGAVKDKDEQLYLAKLVRENKTMNDEDKKYLFDKIYGETKQEQIAKAATGAVAAGVAEDIKEAKKVSKEQKKIADEVKAAMAAGYTVFTAEEMDAYNAVYGGK